MAVRLEELVALGVGAWLEFGQGLDISHHLLAADWEVGHS
jgi:hypothetical protein